LKISKLLSRMETSPETSPETFLVVCHQHNEFSVIFFSSINSIRGKLSKNCIEKLRTMYREDVLLIELNAERKRVVLRWII